MDIRPGSTMAPHAAPDAELVARPDADLVARARDGDRIAFGVLYLRHHAAAWRMASAMSGFSDDAELAVMAGFTDVFAILPRGGDPSFRAHLLHSVRGAALERRRARRHDTAAGPPGHPGDTGSVSAMRRALTDLPETGRATLWLTDVEAMTPAEVASV
ncbi:MAG: RNA polymerase sigma factor, partial [Acidimicrobiia bacterium]